MTDALALPTSQLTTGSLRMLENWKLLASSLDALIRSTRSGGTSTMAVAQRATELWRSTAGVPLIFEPTRIQVGEHTVLEANESDGRWILPTFMCGLRAMSARAEVTIEDLLGLSEELARIEPTTEAISAFQNWLWLDGAEGFDIDLKPSFVEAIETVEASTPQTAAGGAVRGQGLTGLGEHSIAIASEDIDAAAVRVEFELPLDLYAQRWSGKRRKVLTDDERKRLTAECRSPSSWLFAEVSATLEREELISVMPANRLARRFLTAAAAQTDPQLLELLARLAARKEPYFSLLFESLSAIDIGTHLARTVSIEDPDTVSALQTFAAAVPTDLGHATMNALVTRFGRSAESSGFLVHLVQRLGADRFLALVDVEQLDESGASVLIQAAQRLDQADTLVGNLLGRLSPRGAVKVLEALPGERLPNWLETLRRLAETDLDPRTFESLIRLLMRHPFPEGSALVARAITRTLGRRVRPQTLGEILRYLVSQGHADDVLVPLVRSRVATDRVRLAALDALSRGGVPAAVAKAVAWRPSEFLDPPEVRVRLRAARKYPSRGGGDPT